MSCTELPLSFEAQLRGDVIEYTRNVLDSVLLPFARSLIPADEVVIFDVRRENVQPLARTLDLDSFISPKETEEYLVYKLYQPDGSTRVRELPKKLRSLPTEILYDAYGLELFEEITKLDEEYYLTACEREILETKGAEIFSFIPDDASVIELGCGSMTKTAVILDHLRQSGRRGIKFYALDLEEGSLRRSLISLMEAEGRSHVPPDNRIQYGGILGTYDQALSSFLKDLKGPKVFIWLGSSIGNYNRNEASEFLVKFQKQAMNENDLFFIGMDKRNDPTISARAYNDSKSITMNFIRNGLTHLNHTLGQDTFNHQSFDVLAGYNEVEGRNEVYYQSIIPQTISIPASKDTPAESVDLEQNELVRIEVSVKYCLSEIRSLAVKSGLYFGDYWTDERDMYRFCLFKKTSNSNSQCSSVVRSSCLSESSAPTLEDWKQAWRNWDRVSSSELILDFSEQPIGLRHPFIFYIGHIPCFCDILLARCLNEPLTEPQDYSLIFERGIDPIVEDQTQCHPHSAVPETWPALNEILEYKEKVRERIIGIYKSMEAGTIAVPQRRLERILHMVLEHEMMHTETLLYMLVQSMSFKTLTPIPQFLARPQDQLGPAKWIRMEGGVVKVGLDDDEEDDLVITPDANKPFGWDNESPQREASVGSFQIQNRPVSVQEYYDFLKSQPDLDVSLIPSCFQQHPQCDGDFMIKTLYGLIPVCKCASLPITLSYHQADAYKKYLKAQLSDDTVRIPSEEELLFFYQTYNPNLQDNNMNVGLQNFSPIPLSSDVHLFGSVWEWTSSIFKEHDGFKGSTIYAGYSTDFFDTLHNVVVGGSYATHSRQAARLRNFYQRSYSYAFIGVRFIKDV